MFDPEWTEGCKSCSFIADHYNPSIIHLAHRDVTMVTVSRASLAQLKAFKRRMGWSFKWVSSFGNDFNWDYHVSFKPEDVASKRSTTTMGFSRFPSRKGRGSAFSTRMKPAQSS